MNWRVKGVVQKALGVVPGGTRINDALQRTFGELRDVDAVIDSKVLDDWVVLAEELTELDVPITGSDMLEVGTGWLPVFPLCFALCGAQACYTFDLERHLNPVLTLRALARLEQHLERIATSASVPVANVRDRYRRLAKASDVASLFERAHIHYRAPGDASRTDLQAATIDIIYSNSVLEHVPRDVIFRIFQEGARVLRAMGLAIHSVNCGDHYAYFDKSITSINYLRYTDRQWQFWNNRLLYQNRLRPMDFLQLARESGLDVTLARHRPKPKLLAALEKMAVAPEFKAYSAEDLCTTSIDFAARPRQVTR